MSYNLNTIVSNQEAEALKEMIFKRARERAESLNKEIQSSYTDSVQNDIMDMARTSFVDIKNPFSISRPVEPAEQKELTKAEEIVAAKQNITALKSQIYNKTKIVNKDFSAREIEDTMSYARGNFEDKRNFVGALEFLNSQASIALVNRHGKQSFEAMA